MESAPTTTESQNTGRVLLTVEAAARQLSVGRTTMYQLIKAGDIATVRVGQLRRVPAAALDEYIERLTGPGQAAA